MKQTPLSTLPSLAKISPGKTLRVIRDSSRERKVQNKFPRPLVVHCKVSILRRVTIVIPSASDDKSHGSSKPVSVEEDRSARVGAMLYFLIPRQSSDHWVSVFSPKLVSTCHLER